MKKFLLAGCVFFLNQLLAQDSTQLATIATPFTLSGYVESYYSYDFGKPATHTRPSFLYNFNQHNEFNLNLGFIKAAFATDRVRH